MIDNWGEETKLFFSYINKEFKHKKNHNLTTG